MKWWRYAQQPLWSSVLLLDHLTADTLTLVGTLFLMPLRCFWHLKCSLVDLLWLIYIKLLRVASARNTSYFLTVSVLKVGVSDIFLIVEVSEGFLESLHPLLPFTYWAWVLLQALTATWVATFFPIIFFPIFFINANDHQQRYSVNQQSIFSTPEASWIKGGTSLKSRIPFEFPLWSSGIRDISNLVLYYK